MNVVRASERGEVAPAGSTPLFLVGPARSGTSLVYKALCLHPQVAYISNWVARFPSVPWLAALNRLAGRFPQTRRRTWFGVNSNAYVYGRRRGLRERLFPMPVEGEPVYASCGIDPLGAVPEPEMRAQRDLRRRFDAIRAASGAPVFVNKRIGNNRRIASLASIFPGARFVAIVRDGRAVALSLSKVDWWEQSFLPWYGGTPADWASEGGDPWEACARNWVEDLRAMEAGLARVPERDVLRLRYEAFIEAPLETLQRVAEFAGLPRGADRHGDQQDSWQDRWHDALAGLTFPNRNGWREKLPPGARETITGVQRPQLEAYGYDI